MILDVDHHTPNEPGPLGKLFDADGKEIEYVKRANTVTGEVTQIELDEFGMMKPDESGESVKLVKRRYPAPLSFVPLLLALCFGLHAETVPERLADGIPSGSSAITPTKGSLWVANGTSFVPLPVGTNSQVLTADSAQTNGIKWATGGGAVDLSADYAWTGTHTFDLSQIWKQTTTPANPPASYYRLYFKSDGKLYKLNSSGTETEIGAGSVTSVTGTAPIASSGGATPAISLNDAGVTYAKFQDVTARSVVGRSAATDGVTAAITASSTGQVLRYSGTTLGFGAVDLADTDAITNQLPVANGGTGVASLTAYAPLFGGTTATGTVQSGTVGSAGEVLTSNGAGALPTFQAAAGGAPFTDTTSIVKGSADATKLFRVEVDGFTAGATRVMTPPNSNFTASGIDIANTWTAFNNFTGNIARGSTTNDNFLEVLSSGTNVDPWATFGNSDMSQWIQLGGGRSGDPVQRIAFKTSFEIAKASNPQRISAGQSITTLMTLNTSSMTMGTNIPIHIPATAISGGGSLNTNGTQQGKIVRSLNWAQWTNAMVTALGATTSGEINGIVLSDKQVVTNVWIIISGAASGPTTVTVSCGRTGAAYVDYIVASDAKAAAATVYGDTAAERGTNNTMFDLPSYGGGTTQTKLQFVSTGANLSTVTGCSGTVIFEVMTLP